MDRKIFIDSDIILDVGLIRVPFFENSKTILALAETGWLAGFTSSNCIANIYYFIRKKDGDITARGFLSAMLKFVEVLPIDHAMTLEALESDFTDFEDALQYGAALRKPCDCIITRNIGDYKNSRLDVYTPDEFLQRYAG